MRLPVKRRSSRPCRKSSDSHAGARYSEASIHAGTVYLAGQVAVGGGTSIEAQASEVLASIYSLLAEAGSSRSRILMAQIYLADMADYAGLNSVWDQWVGASTPVARDRGRRNSPSRNGRLRSW
ncbi:MAG: RidA family protein [Steroidobacteraceae bacterium]